MNRTRPGTATGGSMARIVMIAGTALIQVICRVPISSQKPRRLNLRSTTRQAPAARVPSSPTTSALMWNSGRQQYPRSAGVSRWCAATAAATWVSWSSRSRMPFGVPVVPLVHRKIPPRPVAANSPSGPEGPGPGSPSTGSPDSQSSPTSAHGCATFSIRATSAAGAPGSSGTATRPAATMPTRAQA